MNTALLLIDIQNDYFPGGRYPLDHPEEAAMQQPAFWLFSVPAGCPSVMCSIWEDPTLLFRSRNKGR